MSFRELIGPGKFIEPAVIQKSAGAGDLWYPYAARMPIPENQYQPRIIPTQFILHTMSGPYLTTIDDLFHYIARSDVNGESTFIGDMAGRVAQVLEANIRADNNYKANQRAISIETQDRGYIADPGIEDTPWPDPLMAQLAGITAWVHLRFKIPLERPADWDDPGVDGHRAHAEWSIYTGKTCPGEARWNQIPDVIAAAREIVEWDATPVPDPDPLPTPDPTPDPTPIVTPKGARPVHWLIMKYTPPGTTADSGWSGYYSDGNRRYPISAASGGLNHCARLVKAGAKDAVTGAVITSATWGGVSATADVNELTRRLGPA